MRICMSTIGACREPWREALAATAAAGFDAVEILAIDGWIHLDPRRDGAAQVAAELDRHGLHPVGLHGGGVDGTDNAALGASLAYVRRVVDLAAALGCELVNVNAGPVPDGTGPAEREAMRARAIRGIAALVPEVRARGLRLTIENHFRFQLETIADYGALFAAVPDADVLGATIDTWHFAAAGIAPAEAARALGRRVAHVHVKDIGDPAALPAHRALVRELANHGFAGWLSAEVEVADAGAERAAVAASRAWLADLASLAATGARA